jgi:arylsulfatase A-like enzyme
MIARQAADFVERNHAEPFFLYVAFNAVHSPMQAPEKYRQRFSDVTDAKRQTMLAMLSAMDDAVGQLLDKLHEHQLDNDTLVIFISDNGGITENNASLNTPFSGYKAQLFEGGIRVPLLVQWKGHVPAGRVVDQPVLSLDLFTTALAAAGAEPPRDRPIDGVDLMPWLTGAQETAVHERLYWRYQPQWALREGNFKLIGLAERFKLFDLSADPQEKTDLSAEHPEVVKRLREAYAGWEKQLVPPLWVPDAVNNMDADEFDRQEPPIQAKQRRSKGLKEGA